LGVVPPDTKLTTRSKGLPAWDGLNADQKRLYARMMEVFAAYGAQVDVAMGRIVDAVKELPDADNTMIIYIAGDNGSSAEGGLEGSLNENLFFNGFPERWQDNLLAIDDLGGPKHFNHFPSSWAHAMNTPFQWTKQVASHFGGTRNPMIISWPSRIGDKGGLRDQFLHVIDIVPTIYEVCGVTPPRELNGVPQKPVEGLSFADTFDDAKAPAKRKTQYFELGCNRGLYHDGWMASAPSFAPWEPVRDENWNPDKAVWELYKLDGDFSQANDLAKDNPQKLRELQDMWWVEAAKYNVLPLDWRATIRMNAEAMGRPSLVGKRTKAVYHEGMIALPGAACLPMLNKSFTITAEVDLPDDKAQGMIVTQGGSEGGYGLYMREGKPTFVYNYLGKERPTLVGEKALPAGKATLVVDFAYDGGGMGKGGKLTLTANGAKVAEARLERSVPIQFAIFEGLDVGLDTGSAVDFTYQLPFAFTGKIRQVTVEIQPAATQKTPAEAADAKMARQ
ncbi:MAG: sulfatase-like hydrolase/transferase, partial [Phenylobacterium sp.]